MSIHDPEVLELLQDCTWATTDSSIEFPEGKSLCDYVMDIQLGIICGEAPYITSRNDVTNEGFTEPKSCVELLDRKLCLVDENIATIP